MHVHGRPSSRLPYAVAAAVAGLLLSAVVQARTLHVDDDAAAGGDGVAWASAFAMLQDAMALAESDPAVTEIRVAAGRYVPDRDEAGAVVPGDRLASFHLRNGLLLAGGYRGLEGGPSGDPDERDPIAFRSILTGDLLNDDALSTANRAENSYHVVTAGSVGASAVIDGFVITAGHANGTYPHDRGAGLHNAGGQPRVRNCVFESNWAANGGGAIYSANATGGVVSRCVFEANEAIRGGAVYNLSSSLALMECSFIDNTAPNDGGAVFNSINSNPRITQCVFERNSAGEGGAIYNFNNSMPVIVGCRFIENEAASSGGAVSNYFGSDAYVISCRFMLNRAGFGGAVDNSRCSPLYVNCSFACNSAISQGGAVYHDDSNASIVNCSFCGNSAGVYGGGIYHGRGSATVANTILWHNHDTGGMDSSAQIHVFGGGPQLGYCIIQGGWTGAGGNNLTSDPWLMNEVEGDHRLCPGSIAIDAGDNAAVPADTLDLNSNGDYAEPIPFDLVGRPRFMDDAMMPDNGNPAGTAAVVDIGAHEYDSDCNTNGIEDAADLAAGSSADCNANGIPDECEQCGDIDADGDVDEDDFDLFVASYGHGLDDPHFNACIDYDGDGVITQVDYQTWLVCYRAYQDSRVALSNSAGEFLSGGRGEVETVNGPLPVIAPSSPRHQSP